MRSRWPAEIVVLWLATATLEAAWITLVNLLLQWFKQAERVDLTIIHYFLAVLLGMVLARTFRNVPQNRYALILTVGAVGSAVIGALISGAPANDIGAFVRTAILDPGAWLMGFAVLRGVFQADPGSGYETERVFRLGIPGLVVFWILTSISGMTDNQAFTLQAFAATLSFISAGLLAMGLGRLKDLDVDSVDRGARRRWVLLVMGIVGVVLVVGLPLAAVLGLPVTSVILGVLGPVAPLLIGLFGLMSIPIFWLLDLFVGLLRPNEVVIPSFNVPSPLGAAPPPLFEPPTGPPPDLTWLLIALVLVGSFVLLRIVATFLSRPTVSDGKDDEYERRYSEPIVVPSLPSLPRLRLPGRRPMPRTASQAYVFSIAALGDGELGRLAHETPREHSSRVLGSDIGRDIGRLATDYQLDVFAGIRVTAAETGRALERWRRVVAKARRKR
jgi:hypothetical protein